MEVVREEVAKLKHSGGKQGQFEVGCAPLSAAVAGVGADVDVGGVGVDVGGVGVGVGVGWDGVGVDVGGVGWGGGGAVLMGTLSVL